MACPAQVVTHPAWMGRKPAERGELRSLGRYFQLNNQCLIYKFVDIYWECTICQTVLSAREAIVKKTIVRYKWSPLHNPRDAWACQEYRKNVETRRQKLIYFFPFFLFSEFFCCYFALVSGALNDSIEILFWKSISPVPNFRARSICFFKNHTQKN